MYDIGRHPPRGRPHVVIPSRIIARTFEALTAPLVRRVPITSRQRNVHLLMSGSKVLSWKASDALQQVTDNLAETSSGQSDPIASVDSERCLSPLHTLPPAPSDAAVSRPCTAWIPRAVVASLQAMHRRSNGSGNWWMPSMQAELYGDALLPCAALRLSAHGIDEAPPAFKALVSRIQALGTAATIDENAALGLRFCADAGIALSASGRPYGADAIARALRERMAYDGHHAAATMPGDTVRTSVASRLFRMPYWVTEDEARLFGTHVRAGEAPTVVAVPPSRQRGPTQTATSNQRSMALFNAEQTADPTRFNTRSCNTTLYPFVLPGSIMHWGSYRPPISGGAALAMSWTYQQDSEACSANVWVERKYMELLGLTDNGRGDHINASGDLHPKRLLFLNSSHVVEQPKVAFYIRYVPCLLGGHGRLFGMNGVLCAKAAFRAESASPYWIHWSQLEALRRMRSDDVREVATAYLRDETHGGSIKERFVNVAFSSLDGMEALGDAVVGQ